VKYLVILMAAALLAVVYHNHQLSNQVSDEQNLLAREDARLANLEKQTQVVQAQKQEALGREQATVAELERQIQLKQKQHDDLAAQVTAMGNLSDGGRQMSAADWDLKNKKDEIDRLQAQLDQNISQRNVLQNQKKLTGDQVKAEKNSQELAIEQQIESEKEKITAMQNRHDELKIQKYDFTAKDEARKLAAQIKEENLVLGRLNVEKKAVSVSADIAATQGELGSTIARLKNEEASFKSQLATARADYKVIQSRMNEARKQQGSQTTSVASVQKQIDQIETALKDLRQQLATHEQNLQTLKVAN
jgi:DNA repair exonuclease SbcCD ATPase subunit